MNLALLVRKRYREALCAYKSALLLDPTLKEPKRNVHSAMKKTIQVGLTGTAAVVIAVKGMLRANRLGADLLVPAIITGVIILTGYFLWQRRKVRLNLATMAQIDPQLVSIYRQLEADKKKGLLR